MRLCVTGGRLVDKQLGPLESAQKRTRSVENCFLIPRLKKFSKIDPFRGYFDISGHTPVLNLYGFRTFYLTNLDSGLCEFGSGG